MKAWLKMAEVKCKICGKIIGNVLTLKMNTYSALIAVKFFLMGEFGSILYTPQKFKPIKL